MKIGITWRAQRLDEGDEPGPPTEEGMIGIEGRIEIDGRRAGTTDGFHLLAWEPDSDFAVLEFWDLEQWTFEMRKELSDPDGEGFRQPLPRLLEEAPGILCIRHLALEPEFRGRGLGGEVVHRIVADWADEQVGAVLLNGQPLQHRRGAYDDYDEEVRELPWDGAEQDGQRLARHLRGWGFHRIAGTRWMVATPAALGVEGNGAWPPVAIG